MIQHIKVFSKDLMAAFVVSADRLLEPWICISISSRPEEALFSDPSLKKMALSNGCVELLEQHYGDFSNEENYHNLVKNPDVPDGFYRIFSTKEAKEIIDLLNRSKEGPATHLRVHCDAGISRSGAVGLFACRYLKLDEKTFRTINPFICPNQHIFQILCKVSGIRQDYISFWKKNIGSKILTKVRFT